ncbi:hypothetical protein CALCODRAFT_517057 [Calocera cornea HHB12733]|uniref:Protein CPL1-like domain-containing protein n=1 Tax=Calocera cornea HHB12733 TaxID=1353952 RepID=A0A165GEL3_9BASI|nr:hypothetical protein CALCODRAFT_517057 [Calocera cornea HHB12733]
MRPSLPLLSLFSLLALPFVNGAILPRTPLLDVCAHVQLNLLAELGIITDLLDLLSLGLPLGITGEVDVCLCLSALPLFLTANVDAAAAVSIAGDNAVSAVLEAAINRIAGGNKCQYPPHSKSVCTAETPCGYQCDTGYHQVGNQCLLAAPSGHARARSLAAAPTCAKAGEKVCGTANGKRQWECVDVLSELESCGGCIFAPPFPELASTTPLGTDCTTIPHVADVRCSIGACVIQKCNEGFVPSSDRTACVASERAPAAASHRKGGKHAHGHHVVGDILGQMVGMVVGK